jgi:hypothetical protein
MNWALFIKIPLDLNETKHLLNLWSKPKPAHGVIPSLSWACRKLNNLLKVRKKLLFMRKKLSIFT